MYHMHVLFLIQSVPMYSSTKIVRTVKSITDREIFRHTISNFIGNTCRCSISDTVQLAARRLH